MANRPATIQNSRRIQHSSASVRTTWLYRPDSIQCLTSIRVSASRHSYGKTAATVRTMCDPIRTMSSIRQVVHTNFNSLNVSLHGPDDQASYMEIVYTSSTIRTSAFRVRMVITCSRSATIQTRPCYGNFQCYFGKAVAVDRPDAGSSRSNTLGYFDHNFLVKYRIGTKISIIRKLTTNYAI